jgi:hypothetical protein
MGLLSTIGAIAGNLFFGGPSGGTIGSIIGGVIEGNDSGGQSSFVGSPSSGTNNDGSILGTIGSALGGSIANSRSIGQASQTQQQAAQGGIDETRRQYDEITKLLSPYTQAGAEALTQQQALLGLGAPGAQQESISAIEGSPQFQALQQHGENAILQNASATGGLRGGNVQGALAQFRPALLSSLINQQYERLGGLSSLGQSSAVRQGTFGQQAGASVSSLIGQQGRAEAGGILGQQSTLTGGINKAIGAVQGAGGFGKLFGNTGGEIQFGGIPAFQGGGQTGPMNLPGLVDF